MKAPRTPTAVGRRELGPLALAACLVLLAVAAFRPGARRSQPAALPKAQDLALACHSADPYVAVVLQGGWSDADRPAEEPAILLARQGLGSASPALVSRQALGDVYGLAYDAARGQVYAGAWHRRGGRFGPGGPGAVYRIDLADGAVSLLAQLNGGPDRHATGGGTVDDGAWAGKTSLGDLDIAADGQSLFVSNLFEGKVYRLSLPDGRVLGSFAHGAVRERWAKGARLMGLGVLGDEVYHGLVDSREDPGILGLLEGRVYRSKPDGSEMTQVLRFGLGQDGSYQRNHPWGPWTEDLAAATPDQPLLADIAFLASGLPVVGLRDRRVDLEPGCVWDPACPGGSSLGDVLPARPRVNGSGWELVRSPQWFRDTDPGGQETSWGAATGLPGLNWIAAPARPADGAYPEPALSLHAFDEASGLRLRSSRLWPPDQRRGGAALAAGDATVLCGAGNEVPPEVLATLTAEAQAAATATAAAREAARATGVMATRRAHVPTRESRSTAAVETATALAPTLAALPGTAAAARERALATAATYVARQLTLVAPTAAAVGTSAARATAQPPATATAYARAYQRIEGSCQGGNPYLAVSQFVPMTDGAGNAYDTAWLRSQAAVVALNDTLGDDLAEHANLAFQDQVGAVFGVASDLTRDHIYVGAYTKRLAGFGPLGPGGIYRIDTTTGTVLPWAALPAGRDPHRFNQAFDQAAANSVGVTGLGDLELTASGDQLFAVNLNDGYLYRFEVPSGRLLGAFPHGGAGLAWEEDARPFALAWKDGWLYHGVVDSRQRDAQAANNPAPRPLAAYVYRSRADGSAMEEVSRVDLAYGRQPPWNAWPRVQDDSGYLDHPMLVDIEFREDGDLVLGLRDRQADSRVLIAAGGDMVLTLREGGHYIPLTVPEFYQDNLLHAESSWGTLASLPWLDQVVSTVIDPIQIYSGGLAWYDNISGYDVGRETVYAGANQTFGKAAGLGDLESLCVALTPTPTVPAATASATATATATASASPTSSPTPTATPTVTPSATTGVYRIYLPFLERLLCRPESIFTDAVLVLDMSTSMYRETRGGRSKHEAALAAARAFIAQMKLERGPYGAHDRVAVVGFNDLAWTQIGLSGDRAAVLAALDGLPARIAQGTRIDLALEQGQAALAAGPRQGVNQQVMILLTDGLPNRVPFGPGSPDPDCPNQECTVLRRADAAKSAATRIFTIGLGETDDVLDRLLGAVASSRADYFFAPDGEDLADIYRGIAGRLTACP